jgi:hypothetical protein
MLNFTVVLALREAELVLSAVELALDDVVELRLVEAELCSTDCC